MTGIFISYRRSDSAGHAGRLADDLGERLAGESLFRDFDAIEAGEDFVTALERAVAACSVMLVVIGPTWARVAAPDGQRRLHQPGDFVRMEVEAAIARDIRIIPVLVGDAQMPLAADLPESMQGLLRRNAFSISDRRWQFDLNQLTEILRKHLGAATPPAMPASPPNLSAPLPPATKRSMPSWQKIILGLAVAAGGMYLTLVMISMVQRFSGSSKPDAAIATTTLSLIEQRAFLGLWRAENADEYLIDTADDGSLFISAGSRLASVSAFSNDAAPVTKAGEELFCDARFEGAALRCSLIDAFSQAAFELELALAPDGKTLSGTVTDPSGERLSLLLSE